MVLCCLYIYKGFHLKKTYFDFLIFLFAQELCCAVMKNDDLDSFLEQKSPAQAGDLGGG